MACNFNCLFKNEGLLKFTGSLVCCTAGNISETVQDRISDIVITDLIANDVWPIE